MPVQLKEVSSKKDLRTFIQFPHKIHEGNPAWVPALGMDEMNTLRKDKNPAFDHCQAKYWLAYKNGEVAGRVAAINNPLHAETWGQYYMRFGWIDFIDDEEVSGALIAAVEDWAKELGKTAVHGPLGFTDLDREGMLVEGFDELGTLVTRHDPPHYAEHMKKLGYEKDVDWLEHDVVMPDELDERIIRVAEIARKRYRLSILEAKNKKELLPYAPELFEILNDAYSHLYGVVHLTDKQIETYVNQYFGFVQPDFVPAILNEEGRMVAFAISMPSLSRALQKGKGRLFPFGWYHLLRALNNPERIDLYLGAVRREYQGRGINALIMVALFEGYKKHGVKTIHANPQLETNRPVWEQWKYFQARQHKRRRVFIKHL
jgi:GNAT superfamily N-acetyltransferase